MQEDETTTAEQSVDTGAQDALPEEQTTDAADNSDAQVSEESSDEGAEALPEVDDKLQSFAKGQGIEDVSELSEREQKLLKVAYDNNASFQRNRQKASEMEKTMTAMSDESAEVTAQATGQDPEVLKRLQKMEVRDSIRNFWDSHPDARNYEADMAKIAVESGLYGTPEAILEASYAIAMSRNSQGVKSEAKREALKSLASKQQAQVPSGSATNQAAAQSKITKENVDQLIAQNGQDWFKKNYDVINRVLAS